MSNAEISKLLRNVAASYATKDEKKYYFQIIAYQKAAEAIEQSTTELKDAHKENALEKIPGVGPTIRKHLEELFETGKVKHFEEVMQDVPKAMFPLLDIPSFGPKKAFKLVTFFDLKNPATAMNDLEKIAMDNKIAQLEGFGEKSQQDILQAISEYRQGTTKSARMVYPFAHEIAEKIIEYMKKHKAVKEIQPLGSLRRKVSTIGDVDLAVASKEPEKVIEHFVSYPYKERVIERGPATSSILISGGKHIDLMVQQPERFGSLLQHFTGSKHHNIHLRELALKKGLSLSEYGIKHKKDKDATFKSYDTEEKFYKALGMEWIPPEIREDTGEIELAQKNAVPKLVELSDIRGDFHIHSNFPLKPSHDLGRNTIEEMVKKALSLGYSTIGFSEHNPSVSNQSKKQIYDHIARRNEEIDKVQSRHKSIRIFKLLEIDILVGGSLAIDDNALSLLDGALVSIHSSFSMEKKAMTKRVLQGLSHPKAKILSHPTGRLINERPGYDLEWDSLFAFAKEHNKALEINSWPVRLDLPDALVKEAVEHGVKLIIDTDSHAADQMDNMQYGVAVARRGWATRDAILNTMEYNKFSNWLKE